MALQFKNIKNPKLGLTDLLQFGKLRGCRICDVAQDHYEYLIWAEKSGFVKYQPEVIELLLEQANFVNWQLHQEQEIKPWLEDITDDDVPF